MQNKKPPFNITSTILNRVTTIAELVGKISATPALSPNPTLRRTNRIKTIYSSLAIEQNTLNIEQVTDVINGKRVIAPPKDIKEVKNAYEIYEMMDSLDPYSVDDLLSAHAVLTRDLVSESGCFRTGAVGVVDSNGNVLHFGTLPAYVPDLTMELLNWTKLSDIHILIKSCVFHYELELIHPFADGNGRIGRLWHTLLLTKWNPLFAYIPIESIIHKRQDEYYKAINTSNVQGESTVFIEFMLSAIEEALTESVQPQKKPLLIRDIRRIEMVMDFVKKNGKIHSKDAQEMFGVSPASATRILSMIVNENKLIKIRDGKTWAYIAK